jgi:hypothetical protein
MTRGVPLQKVQVSECWDVEPDDRLQKGHQDVAGVLWEGSVALTGDIEQFQHPVDAK